MTAYRFVTLTCDRCGQIWDSGTSRSVRDARADAARNGWTVRWDDDRRRLDWCGVCSGTHERRGYGDNPIQPPVPRLVSTLRTARDMGMTAEETDRLVADNAARPEDRT